VLKRIVDFEVAPPQASETRGLVALATSALVHAAIILFFIFGIPLSSEAPGSQPAGSEAPQPIALAPPRSKKVPPLPRLAPQPRQAASQPPPPPPMKEVELGPDSKKPDAPAKEAAAKQSDAEAAAAANAKAPEPPPPPPTDQPKPPDAQPPAPQRIQVPRPGDYTGVGRIPLPTTSPWGPPKLDSASGAPPSVPAEPSAGAMGRSGLSNRDPSKWENSFDNETSGRCTEIPDLGKNPDGSPVLATVIGRVLDTDGRSPLGGAHLQIMGTQFGTFSDANGEYRLAFDPHMLEKCRKQYVQVVAPGYRGELLTLMIGPRVRSDDVVLHKH
jgi:hypothetical protein